MVETALDQNVRFELFPNLPIELRLKIWKYSEYNNHREIFVKARIITQGEGLSMNVTGVKYSASTRTPPTLHACHESREVGLESYKPAVLEISGDKEEHKIYVNFETDTLYLQYWLRRPITMRDPIQSILSPPFTTTGVSSLLSRFRLQEEFADCYANMKVEEHATGLDLSIASIKAVPRDAAWVERGMPVIAMISKSNGVNLTDVEGSIAKIGYILSSELAAWNGPVRTWDVAWRVIHNCLMNTAWAGTPRLF